MAILLELKVSFGYKQIKLSMFAGVPCYMLYHYFRLLLNVLNGQSGSNRNLVLLSYIMDCFDQDQ